MLVCFRFGNIGEVEDVAGVEHCFRQRLLLCLVHAIQVNGHEQRADLVVSNATAGNSADEEVNLFAG